MPDFGRSRNDDPSLDAVLRSDQFIEALAAGRPVAPQDDADAALARMLEGWRDETRWPPATGLISEPQAIAALRAGVDGKQTTKRSRRGLSIVGAAAAAVLCIGGFGAVVAGSGPGDALYGLRTMLFGAPTQVRDDQVALAAKTEMQQVQELIARGDWQQAQDKLVSVSTQVATIGDQEQKQQLMDQWNQLSAKVVQRDPEATVPPGITYTVPPSATELVPTVVPTSVPTAPPITISPPSDTTATSPATSEPTSPETSPTTPSTPPGTASPSPTTSPVPATGAATTTPTTATAPPTTTTSAGPAGAASTTAPTNPPATTTQAPTGAATPTTTTPSPAAAPPAPVTTTSAVVQQSAVTAAPSTSVAEASIVPAAPSTVVQAPVEQTVRQQPPAMITTTVMVPLPVPQTGTGGAG